MVFSRCAATACGAQQCAQCRELLRRPRRAQFRLYTFAAVSSAGSTCPAVRARRVFPRSGVDAKKAASSCKTLAIKRGVAASLNMHNFALELYHTALNHSQVRPLLVSDECREPVARASLSGRLTKRFRHARLLLTLRPIYTFTRERMIRPWCRRGCLLTS